MSTVLVFERLPVHPDAVDTFADRLRASLELMHSCPGLLWADAAEAMDDQPSWVVLSEWRTSADADAWESDPGTVELREALDPLLRGEVTRRRFADQPG